MEYSKTLYLYGTPTDLEVGLPKGMTEGKQFPAVILCHGFSRHRNDGLQVLAETLNEQGFVTLRFDFRGCGEHAAHKYFEYCASEWPRDLVQAVNYAESLPFVDRARIGAAGISMGACTVVYTAGMDERIKSVAAMSGIADCREWLHYVWDSQGGDFGEFVKSVYEQARISAATGNAHVVNVLEMYHMARKDRDHAVLEAVFDANNSEYIAWHVMQELLMYKPVEHCPGITQPIFFLTGGEDTLVPKENSQRMYNAVLSQKKKMKEYPGVEHNMPIDPQRNLIFADITDWFRETL